MSLSRFLVLSLCLLNQHHDGHFFLDAGYPLMMAHERISKILSGDDNKAIQKIVVSLGHACMNEASYSHLKTAMDLIFSLCRSKVGFLESLKISTKCAGLISLLLEIKR